MQTLKRWLSRAAIAASVFLVGWILLGTIRAGEADVPKPKDLARAKREAKATRGGSDYRTPIAAAAVEPQKGQAGWIAGQGIVEPADRELKVGAQLPGVIRKVLVAEGERVVAGQALVELDDDVERAQVAAAQADVENARVQVERTREGHRDEEIRAAAADARAAEARSALSDLTMQRQRTLHERGAATGDDFDKARYLAEIDGATREAQKARAEAQRHGWRRDIDVADAQLAQARAHLVEARAKLERLTVRAPSAGTVLQLVMREGEYYNPASGTSLVVLGDLSKIRVRLDVDERDVAGVKAGQSGFVTVEAFGERRFPGQVVEIGRRMGRKNLRTDEPTERIDTKILEVVVQLEDGRDLVPGLRAFGYLGGGGEQ
jgi:HlyD family secretion protein